MDTQCLIEAWARGRRQEEAEGGKRREEERGEKKRKKKIRIKKTKKEKMQSWKKLES